MRVTVPMLPPHEASPNVSSHWRAKASAIKQFRRDVFLCIVSERNKIPNFHALKHCDVDVMFHVPDERFVMDDDNARASLKAAQDAFQDAGIVQNDRTIRILSVGFTPYSRMAPAIVFEIYLPCLGCGVMIGEGHDETAMTFVGVHCICGTCRVNLLKHGFLRIDWANEHATRCLLPDGQIKIKPIKGGKK